MIEDAKQFDQRALMARLAPIATIFLPLSFLIGFLGQNFSTLIDIQTGWVSFILLGPVLEALAIVAIWAGGGAPEGSG